MTKKNMGTVRDLINSAPDGTIIEDGVRSYSKQKALTELGPKLLNAPVHCVKEGCVYIQQVIELMAGVRSRPIIVMAVRIVKEKKP